MPGSITPLPIMEEEAKQKALKDQLPPPAKSLVVRYGYMREIAELPNPLSETIGCGSKVVIETARGTEIATLLTTTCPNAGCGHAVTRKEMLQYIDNSGGKNYPFTTSGKVLRVATVDDLTEQSRLDARRTDIIKSFRREAAELDLQLKLVDVEQLLGGERIIFHYTAESYVDFRELVKRMAAELHTRIEMHQVNARDEARLVADYEKCGQHCCCRQFLKVLKPVSIKSAKIQKATLDPAKISGRCGRLMCCLRYEDETYDSLRKNLPRRKSRVVTEEDGPGTVMDTQILTQLALVRLDKDGKTAAYPIEYLQPLAKEDDPTLNGEQDQGGRQATQTEGRGGRGRSGADRGGADRSGSDRGERRDRRERSDRGDNADRGERADRAESREPRRPRPGAPLQEEEIESREGDASSDVADETVGNESVTGTQVDDISVGGDRNADQQDVEQQDDDQQDGDQTDVDQTVSGEGSEDGGKKKRRRRRRGRGGRGRGRGRKGGDGNAPGGEGNSPGDGGNGSGGSGNNTGDGA